jgi:hypothetical protein
VLEGGEAQQGTAEIQEGQVDVGLPLVADG